MYKRQGLGLGAAPLCTLFGLSDASGKAGSLALRIYCISILPSLWNQIAIYYQQTTQRECSALVIQTLRLFVCFLAPMFALAPFGLNAFWWVFPLSELMTLCYVLFSSERHKAFGRSAADPKASPVIRSFSAYIQDAGLLGGTVEQLQRTCEEWDCTSQQSYYATLVVEEVCAAILEDAKNNHRKMCIRDRPTLLTGLANMTVILLGAALIMKGRFTVGMLLAFQGFLSAFMSPVDALLTVGQKFQEMRTSMERVEDVMNYPADVEYDEESETETKEADGQDHKEAAKGLPSFEKLRGRLELRDITFGYSRLAPPLIRDFSLTLPPLSLIHI